MPWSVSTIGDRPDEHEYRDHDTSAAAWSDYWGRILEFEIHGYRRDGPETVACSESGRWLCREPGGEWRRCEHWAIDKVLKERRTRAVWH